MEEQTNIHNNQVIDPHTLTVNEIKNITNTDVISGLSSSQVIDNQKKYGLNKFKEKKKANLLVRFFAQFKDVMILILLFAALISFIPIINDLINGIKISPAEWAEPFIIVFIVIMNAIIGMVSNSKADKAIESLKDLTINTTRVIRDNKLINIKTEELTIDDIIYFEAGDNIYADARIIEANNLKVIESSLTGESTSVDKNVNHLWKTNTSVADRDNMVFSCSSIVNGSGKAIVTSIGMQTEIGKVASMLEEAKPQLTPLQKQLAKFGKWLSIACVIICAIVFIFELIEIAISHESNPWNLKNIFSAVMIAICIAVAAIPEGLPIVITINMSIGVSRMAKQKAIIKNLASVETLGAANVICSDKTGTLTQNKMTLVDIYDFSSNKIYDVTNNLNDISKKIIEYCVLCSNASIEHQNNKVITTGDPTELAFIYAYNSFCNNTQEKLNDDCQRLFELPFDSNRKLMSSVNQIKDENYVITKGAVDQLIKCCNLTSKEVKTILKHNDLLASKGQRVLGVAIKKINKTKNPFNKSEIEKNLTFIGLVGLIDPPREEVKESINKCHQAGIKVVMITGDHVITAKVIGQQLNIFNKGDIAITGEELDQMSEKEFIKKIEKISVYARVSPANKLRIVNGWQKLGKIVAMTGDGVNDAPALKQADIGCAMGKVGTDVAKDASDMILSDDNFSTIEKAVIEGRNIFKNITKVINFLISTNISEIITIVLVLLIGFSKNIQPLNALQILWINLVTDSFPAFGLGLDPISKSLMLEKPRNTKLGLFANKLWLKVGIESLFMASMSTACFWLGYYQCGSLDPEIMERSGSTLCFICLSSIQIFQTFNLKSNQSIFKSNIFDNKWLLFIAFISLILIWFICLVPQITSIFSMETFFHSNNYLLYIYTFLIFSMSPFLFMECEKLIFNKFVWNK